MKKLLLLFCSAVSVMALFSQDAQLIVFSDASANFHLSVNGFQINSEATNKIKRTFSEGDYSLKIVFKDASSKTLLQDIHLNAGDSTAIFVNQEGLGETTKNNAFVAKKALEQKGKATITYEEKATEKEAATIKTNANISKEQEFAPTGKINIANESVYGKQQFKETNEPSTETVEISSTNQEKINQQPTALSTSKTCSAPMDDSDFSALEKIIDMKSYEESKLTIAKEATKSNCLSTSQIVTVMNKFSTDETRTDFAKFAHNYCADKNNYWKVSGAIKNETLSNDLLKSIGQ